MKLTAPTHCPVCGGDYEITKLTCKKCGSELCGHFSGCEFCELSEEDSFFVLTFLKCRGSIKDVEKELGISYPTVRSKLDNIIKRLGLKSTVSAQDLKEQRQDIIDRLGKGKITADQAAEELRNL